MASEQGPYADGPGGSGEPQAGRGSRTANRPWLRRAVPLGAALAVVVVAAGTALAIPESGSGVFGGASPRQELPMKPDAPWSTSPSRGEPGTVVPPSKPTTGQGEPGNRGGGATPWPGRDRPMTGPWAEVGDRGVQLTLHFFGGPATPKECGFDYTATVREARREVVVTVHEHVPGGAPGIACPAISKSRSVTVPLDRPLGERDVVKMPGEKTVPVRGR